MGSASMHGCIILCTQIACAWWMCVTCLCVSRTKHANDTVTLMEPICIQALPLLYNSLDVGGVQLTESALIIFMGGHGLAWRLVPLRKHGWRSRQNGAFDIHRFVLLRYYW